MLIREPGQRGALSFLVWDHLGEKETVGGHTGRAGRGTGGFLEEVLLGDQGVKRAGAKGYWGRCCMLLREGRGGCQDWRLQRAR